jgi:hypothetical protein
MKRLFFMTLAIFLFAACGSNNNKNNTDNVPVVAKLQEKQLNISILLDLSDRISPKINTDATKNDIENINTITEFFRSNMAKLGAYKAKGKIRVFLVPPPSNSDINSIVSKLNIDCSKMDNRGKKEIYDNLTELYLQNLNGIYKETIAASAWIGSDIWRFFKDDVKDYCIESDPNYRNVLIILTDGYLYHEQSKFNVANRFSYLLNSNLAKYRKQDWKQLVEQNDFGIMTERKDLNNLEALVLEVKAENTSNKIDEDILSFVWKKWFNEMNVSRSEVYRSDLPANTKTRIEKFLNQ